MSGFSALLQSVVQAAGQVFCHHPALMSGGLYTFCAAQKRGHLQRFNA
jgi:hypothetical protein